MTLQFFVMVSRCIGFIESTAWDPKDYQCQWTTPETPPCRRLHLVYRIYYPPPLLAVYRAPQISVFHASRNVFIRFLRVATARAIAYTNSCCF